MSIFSIVFAGVNIACAAVGLFAQNPALVIWGLFWFAFITMLDRSE